MNEDTSDTLAERFADLKDAKPWQDMLDGAEKVFQPWQDCCDNIDKQYADLERLRQVSDDREFQIFWANLETLLPAVYSRPPVPVVVPRFKDRQELPRQASEVLERALIANAELDNVHRQYIAIRNDLARCARGAAWNRYDVRDEKYEYACTEHLNRRDFLHEPARSWPEVQWVAKRVWMTKDAGLARFGDEFLKATFSNKNDTPEEYTFDKKAEVWELWHKGMKCVVWLTPGYENVLDIAEPHIHFDGFFPCPEPAYSTRQPDSLIPVPDFLYYKDQIEEINILTARISALAMRLKMKGFYQSGAEDLGTAIEKAFNDQSEGATLIGVPGIGGMGAGIKDAIVWLPVREVAETIAQLVQLRKTLIDDVYQITGISDIMRGQTAASETLGAQELKSQYGAVRVRERQAEMIRIARDCTMLQGEIIAEHFQPDTIAAMTQVDLPRAQDIQQQMMAMKQQAMQADPDQQQAMMAEVQKLMQSVTLEKVMELLRDQRLRPYILDIETDSTIQPDEDAEKQRRAEFVQVLSGLMAQALPLLEAAPEAADFVGEILQFGTAPFRAGRGMEGAIDELITKIKEKASQPPPPDPEAAKAEAEGKRMEMQMQADQQKQQGEMQRTQIEGQTKQMEAQARMAEIRFKAEHDKMMADINMKLKHMDLQLKAFDLQLAEMRVMEAQARPAQVAN